MGPQGPQDSLGSAFTYQGQLKDGGGIPIDNTCDFAFGLWDAASDGSQVGTDCVVSGVAVNQGYFDAVINGGGEFGADAFVGEERWLEIAVQCVGDQTSVTLAPRQLLSPAPYALSLQPGATISGTVPGGNSLTVINNDANGRAVYGFATGVGAWPVGVWGESDATTGTGVVGWSSATSGSVEGVYGVTASTEGSGVFGWAGATEGEPRGVYGLASSPQGRGVYGYASATSGAAYGVYGQSDSTSGTGVYGYSSATEGNNIGVYGRSESPFGHGVHGLASATSGNAYGVWGRSASTAGVGVYGYAYADNGTNYGVLGASGSPEGYGVYYIGGLGGTGLKSSTVRTSDFGWRQLYSVESPESWFEDVGTAQLVDGYARVTIEPIFAQTVDLEQSYQVFLTPMGDCGLYVAEQIATYFTVRALDGRSCTIGFHYRLIAKRLGYENIRLAPVAAPEVAGGLPSLDGQP